MSSEADKKIPVPSTGILHFFIDHYVADIKSATDYYAFGLPMDLDERQYTAGGTNYRYGFNGQEKDAETYGVDGVEYNFGNRIYDTRLGRFLSVDPFTKKAASNSPYDFADNNPIWKIDHEGDSTRYYNETGELLHTSNDKLSNAIVIVKDKNINEFMIWKRVGDEKKVGSSTGYNAYLRKMGITYHIAMIKKFNDDHKDVRYIDPKSGKTTDYNTEHGTFLFDNKGVATLGDHVLDQKTDHNDPSTTNWTRYMGHTHDAIGDIHTHGNEGRNEYEYPGSGQKYSYGSNDRDAWHDINTIDVHDKPNIIVSEYNIYFYGTKLKTNILVNPKNFGDVSGKPTEKTYTPKSK